MTTKSPFNLNFKRNVILLTVEGKPGQRAIDSDVFNVTTHLHVFYSCSARHPSTRNWRLAHAQGCSDKFSQGSLSIYVV